MDYSDKLRQLSARRDLLAGRVEHLEKQINLCRFLMERGTDMTPAALAREEARLEAAQRPSEDALKE